jgi:hypothetical protein
MPSVLPETLTAWRLYEGAPDEFWRSLEPFFAEQGLSLFVGQGPTKAALDNTIRAADGYHHWVPSVGPSASSFSTLVRPRQRMLAVDR